MSDENDFTAYYPAPHDETRGPSGETTAVRCPAPECGRLVNLHNGRLAEHPDLSSLVICPTHGRIAHDQVPALRRNR